MPVLTGNQTTNASLKATALTNVAHSHLLFPGLFGLNDFFKNPETSALYDPCCHLVFKPIDLLTANKDPFVCQSGDLSDPSV